MNQNKVGKHPACFWFICNGFFYSSRHNAPLRRGMANTISYQSTRKRDDVRQHLDNRMTVRTGYRQAKRRQDRPYTSYRDASAPMAATRQTCRAGQAVRNPRGKNGKKDDDSPRGKSALFSVGKKVFGKGSDLPPIFLL